VSWSTVIFFIFIFPDLLHLISIIKLQRRWQVRRRQKTKLLQQRVPEERLEEPQTLLLPRRRVLRHRRRLLFPCLREPRGRAHQIRLGRSPGPDHACRWVDALRELLDARRGWAEGVEGSRAGEPDELRGDADVDVDRYEPYVVSCDGYMRVWFCSQACNISCRKAFRKKKFLEWGLH
jgi:hypothetical protein